MSKNYLQYIKGTETESVKIKTDSGDFNLRYTDKNEFYDRNKSFKVEGYIHTNSKDTVSDSGLASLTYSDMNIPVMSTAKGKIIGYISVGASSEVIGIVRNDYSFLFILPLIATISILVAIINTYGSDVSNMINRMLGNESQLGPLLVIPTDNSNFKVPVYTDIIIPEENVILLSNPKDNTVYLTYTIVRDNVEVMLPTTDIIAPGEFYEWDVIGMFPKGKTTSVTFLVTAYNIEDMSRQWVPFAAEVNITREDK